ncbi:uncharacterized protein [Musca autumnalis]|uniref:uncharacterized protein n=1 Tax=Musca autumnalis TaxID=221902 RepID=UPI003CF23FEA
MQKETRIIKLRNKMCSKIGFGLFIGYGTLIAFSIILIGAIGCLADKNLIDEYVRDMAAKDNGTNIFATASAIRFLTVFLLIAGVLMIIAAVHLIKGIEKKRPTYLIPWLLITFISIVGDFIYNFVVLLKSENPAIKFMFGMSFVVLQAAIFYPIYSLYRQMRKAKFQATGEGL